MANDPAARSDLARRLGALALCLTALAACLPGEHEVVLTATQPPSAPAAQVVEAEEFLLRAPDGSVAARLDYWNGGPRLTMYAAPDQPGVELLTEPRSAHLRLFTAGKLRAHFEASADLNSGRWSMYDDAGRIMVQATTESGASSYGLWGEANAKGVRALLNLMMPPVGAPMVSLRKADQTTRVITVDD